jgi:hypothetical protein
MVRNDRDFGGLTHARTSIPGKLFRDARELVLVARALLTAAPIGAALPQLGERPHWYRWRRTIARVANFERLLSLSREAGPQVAFRSRAPRQPHIRVRH